MGVMFLYIAEIAFTALSHPCVHPTGTNRSKPLKNNSHDGSPTGSRGTWARAQDRVVQN